MPRSYRPVDRDQRFLMPPDMAEWLPQDHLVWFLIDVVDQLDTTVFHRRHPKAGPGRRAYDPDMLLTLLLYSYAVGQRSSRRIETLCATDVAFRVACAQDVPDHSTIARFRLVHEQAFEELFTRVLVMCAQAGIGKVGTVAIDGTKIAANASLGANRTEETLRAEAKRILEEAAAVDAAEDQEFGEARGDELPEQFADPKGRRARIRKALEEIERQKADTEEFTAAERDRAETYMRAVEAGQSSPGRTPAGVDPERLARARLSRGRVRFEQAAGDPRRRKQHARQIRRAERDLAAALADQGSSRSRAAQSKHDKPPRANTTDPDSRVMTSAKGGWLQGYNAQVVVSDDHLILATSITQSPNDLHSYLPMAGAAVDAAVVIDAHRPSDTGTETEGSTGIGTILADAGYFTEENLAGDGPNRLIALGKNHKVQREAREHPADGPPQPDASPTQRMRHLLRTPEGARTYKRRGATVEPVIGHLKQQTGLHRFSRRGLPAAASELNLAATVVNLLKLHTRTAPVTG